MLIHKEGRKTLLLTTIILVLLNGLMFRFFPESLLTFILLFVSVVVYALMLNFFKKPSRVYEGDLLGYVNAPADGKIVVIEKTFEKDFFNEERIQISIFMSFFNAHSNWIPVTGKVVHYSHQEGIHAAFLPKSSHENERSNIIIETPRWTSGAHPADSRSRSSPDRNLMSGREVLPHRRPPRVHQAWFPHGSLSASRQ